MNQSANKAAEIRPSTSSQNPAVLPCGRAVQQTVTYVSSKNVQTRSDAASKVTHLWPDALVIMDIVSKLNQTHGKHGVKIFDFIPPKTRRDSESDCDQGQHVPKEVYDKIMNRIKNMTKDNDHFESRTNELDKDLFAENDFVIVDSESFEVIHKSGKLKHLGSKESKCNSCNCSAPEEVSSVYTIPARNQSDGSSTDGEKPPEKKRRKKILKRSRTPYTPQTQSRGASLEKTATISKPESSCKEHATESRSRNSSRSKSRSRSASCAFSCGRHRSRSGASSYRNFHRHASLSSSSGRSSSSSSTGSYRSSRYRSRSRRRHCSRSRSRSRNHSRRSNKRYRDKRRDRDKDRRRYDASSRSRSHRSKADSSSRHRSLKRSRTKSPETTGVQKDPKENKSKSSASDVKPAHSLRENPRPTTPFYHYTPERPYFYGNHQHADPHMFPRYPYPNFIPHPPMPMSMPMPMPQPGPSHYYSVMNRPYAMNPYMPDVYKIYRKRNKSNLPLKSDNDASDDKKKDV